MVMRRGIGEMFDFHSRDFGQAGLEQWARSENLQNRPEIDRWMQAEREAIAYPKKNEEVKRGWQDFFKVSRWFTRSHW